MGLGFVLIVWAIVLTVLALPVVLALLFIANRTGGRARARRILRLIAVAAPIAVCYAGAWCLAYALWCSEVRGVDPGIGDSSIVPLGQGYSLTFIDVSDEASIFARHETDGVALVSGIKQIGQSGQYVYGLEGPDAAFVLDTKSGALRRSPQQGLPAGLHEIGIAGAAVQPVFAFYSSRRWGWPDVLAAAVLLAPLMLFGARSVRRAWAGTDAQVA